MTKNIMISEIYKSIQGEAAYSGFPCIFIRTSGCPLDCRWCDTVYAFKGGESYSIQGVVEEVEKLQCELVELTGGEPLAQDASIELMQALLEAGKQVMIETSGAFDISSVPDQVHIIMDLKCPGGGMQSRNLYENLLKLKKSDEVKFVIASKEDFEWASTQVKEFNLEDRCQILFSPAFGLVKEEQLVQWMLDSALKARFQLQIHKYIWSPKKKGV